MPAQSQQYHSGDCLVCEGWGLVGMSQHVVVGSGKLKEWFMTRESLLKGLRLSLTVIEYVYTVATPLLSYSSRTEQLWKNCICKKYVG